MFASPMPMMPPAQTEMPAFLTLSRVSSRSCSQNSHALQASSCCNPYAQARLAEIGPEERHPLPGSHKDGPVPTSYFLELVILL